MFPSAVLALGKRGVLDSRSSKGADSPPLFSPFASQVIAACPKKNGLILVCNIGGTLEPTGPSEFGRQSRSLTAAYELVQAGFKNIKVGPPVSQ